MDSILTSIKKLLGMPEPYEPFDQDLIIHINSVFGILTQLGVGPQEGFVIRDARTQWSDYLEDEVKLEMVKTYMYLKTKLVFDPPTNSALLSSMKEMTNEYEWRLNVAVDPGEEDRDG